MSFESDMDKVKESLDKKLSELMRTTSLAVAKQLANATPVDTGRAKGNWFTGLNTKITKTEDSFGANKSIVRAQKALANVKPADDVYIINNLPYIQHLERGTDKFAPFGMVAGVRSRWSNIVKAAARYVSRLK